MELGRVRPFAGTGLGEHPDIQTGSDVGLFTFSTCWIYSKSRLVVEWTALVLPSFTAEIRGLARITGWRT
ncbi:hypothetical protein BDQ94DRAFT_133662 [Aspergillus welwitschiae]|uniref:Uncharacterized protein n=1 Tax=Aspergillus welwitschiae TaxID=1341132 RepID=A0A3F3QKX6_9EURO|nr:hypothetical protein BDQ94DRAFT_133662 [Aspergillus welwitschiae]RDH39775.1 hypothetical protein BDQ94DRAFT_133662 [Aspergillus welwitschiae]